jgi:CheY-like chemotaxis protein
MSPINQMPVSAQDQHLRILLVDDDEYMCELMSAMLNELEVDSVEVASSGQRGLDIYTAAERKPNLLLCDLCMPGMDGFQFLSKMASKSYIGEVAIISSYDKEAPVTGEWALGNYKASALHLAEKLARLQGLKVRATLEKPISLNQLSELIAQVRSDRLK